MILLHPNGIQLWLQPAERDMVSLDTAWLAALSTVEVIVKELKDVNC